MSLFGPPDIDKLKAKRNTNGLIKALKYKDSNYRRRAASALGDLGDRNAVEPLIQALGDNYLDVRRSVVDSLGEIGDSRAVEPLIRLLNDSDWEVKNRTVEALGEIGDARAVDPLIQTLFIWDKLRRESRNICKALIKIGSPAILPLMAVINNAPSVDEVLIQLFERKDSSIYSGAAKILHELKWQPDNSSAGLVFYIYGKEWDRCSEFGVLAVEPLITALEYYAHKYSGQRDSDDYGRTVPPIANALGKIGVPAIAPLIAVIKNKGTRTPCTTALKEIREPQAVVPLIRALKDADPNIRGHVAYTLGKIGDTRTIDPLVSLLNDSDEQVVINATRALRDIGDHSAIDPLIASLRNGNWYAGEVLLKFGWQPDNSEAGAAYWISMVTHNFLARDIEQNKRWEKCVEIGPPAIPSLIMALHYQSPRVREKAVTLLDRLEWKPDSSEAGAAYWIAKGEWDKCLEIGEPAIKPLVTFLLKNSDFDSSMNAFQMLTNLGWKPDSITTRKLEKIWEPKVRSLIGDLANSDFGGNWNKYKAATDKLDKIGSFAVPSLLNAVYSHNYPRGREVARASVTNLGSSAVEPLSAILVNKESDSFDRKYAAEILGEIGDARAVDALNTALKDNEKEVREAAIKALEQIKGH